MYATSKKARVIKKERNFTHWIQDILLGLWKFMEDNLHQYGEYIEYIIWYASRTIAGINWS